jgi:hypothetical protein
MHAKQRRIKGLILGVPRIDGGLVNGKSFLLESGPVLA